MKTAVTMARGRTERVYLVAEVGWRIMTPRPVAGQYLTKTLFRKAVTCPRKLVYATRPDLYPSQVTSGDGLAQYLADEGVRFGNYCKGMFPQGVEVGLSGTAPTVENLVAETAGLLKRDTKRITVFEGAIRHEKFFLRPDILDRVTNEDSNTAPELRLIEVKAKSWNSNKSYESLMWTRGKPKASFLRYVQDVAFQAMVAKLSYPEYKVSSWLMMPDRAKVMRPEMLCDTNFDEQVNSEGDENLVLADNQGIATLVNVDDAVAQVTGDFIDGRGLSEVASSWADAIQGQLQGDVSIDANIGARCSSCEYRDGKAFKMCWEEATKDDSHADLILDLHAISEKKVKHFLQQKKYQMVDLTYEDFELNSGGMPNEVRKGVDPKKIITRAQRQFYQICTRKRESTCPSERRSYIVRKDALQSEMRTWKYPLHFIDFETIAPALPHFSGDSPYDSYAFQLSHHTLDEDHEVKHSSEFLNTRYDTRPSIEFLDALYESIGPILTEGGTLMQWSPHETRTLQTMLASPITQAELSPEKCAGLSQFLQGGSSPMVDLHQLASRHYYVDGSSASTSIKRLLKPTIDASDELKRLYGSPTYNGHNFTNFQWYQEDADGNAVDPYKLIEDFSSDETSSPIAHGGAAVAAYSDLVLGKVKEDVRKKTESSLLRYCELDTLAMVMIVQAWKDFLKE
ncbi:hypothetical protein THAOC_10143 [Thalassiosira oceanica]|uniref:DUF2779 domain-containing protein n=1 Tax=Thalassiosira oceanica TaxID=159749 RepID=K0SUR1_THAOC|nr:hypothetical protein THAOC_10143 [Thalassiosira oceanica]|eukprot:EJK68659.1 hypothetical protein THAOC_10143 [Thalassiosira oceanica]